MREYNNTSSMVDKLPGQNKGNESKKKKSLRG